MDYISKPSKNETQEILAKIAARQHMQAATSTVGTDYFARLEDRRPAIDIAEFPDDMAGATLLSIKPTADHVEQGAIPLKNKDEIKNFKAVAPAAQLAAALRGDDNITSEHKQLAPSAREPEDKAVPVSLCSPNDGQEIKGTCGATPDPTPDTDADSAAAQAQPAIIHPDFFKVRVDFFDNGEVANKTCYTAKLSIQVHEDHDPAENYCVFANFYSRPRDFTAFIEKKECWDGWYDQFTGMFGDICAKPWDFKIKPVISILKERSAVQGRKKYDPLLHTGCILYQVHGSPPVIWVVYGTWVEDIALDAKFQSTHRNAPVAIGYHVDPKRAHLDIEKRSPPMKMKTARDFGR